MYVAKIFYAPIAVPHASCESLKSRYTPKPTRPKIFDRNFIFVFKVIKKLALKPLTFSWISTRFYAENLSVAIDGYDNSEKICVNGNSSNLQKEISSEFIHSGNAG